jgi:thioredoxin-related protein
MGWIPLLAALLCVGILGAIRENHLQSEIGWSKNEEAGLEQARKTRMPLLFYFHAPGCEWCRKMEAETFMDARVVALSRRFVCVRLDSEVDAARAAQYQVQEYPMTVIADSQGRLQARLPGYLSPDRFARVLEIASGSLAPENAGAGR